MSFARLGCVAVLVVGGLAGVSSRSVATRSDDPVAPSFQTAFSLLDNAGYAAALGEAVSGPEDDGGEVANDGSQLTTTRVLGASGLRYDITINAYPSTDTAVGTYTQFVDKESAGGSTGEAIPGIADQAYSFQQIAIVQRGAQILQVTEDLTGPAIEQLNNAKLNGQDPTPIAEAFYRMVILVAQALGPRLDGAAVATPQEVLPANTKNACAGQPALAEQFLGPGATLIGLQRSERPPASMCIVSVGGESVSVFVATDAMLASGIAPLTAADTYAKDLAAAQTRAGQTNGQVTEVAGVGQRAFTSVLPEVDTEVLATSPSGENYVIRAEVAGSFQGTDQDTFAANLLAMAAAVPAAVEAPPTTTTTSTIAPATTIVATTILPTTTAATTVAAPVTATTAGPVSAPPAVVAARHSDGGSSTGVVVIVVLAVLVAGATIVALRKRGLILAGTKPSARGISGESQTHITDLEGSWNIGVAAVPGPASQNLVEDNADA